MKRGASYEALVSDPEGSDSCPKTRRAYSFLPPLPISSVIRKTMSLDASRPKTKTALFPPSTSKWLVEP